MRESTSTKKTRLGCARLATEAATGEQVRLAAYAILDRDGPEEGRQVEHWFQDKAQILPTRDIESAQG